MGYDKKDIALKTGARIKYFRNIKNLSQEELALLAGINPAYIGHIERGIKCPTVATLSKVCDALGISLSELLNFENQKEDSYSQSVKKINLSLEQLDDMDIDIVANIISEIVKLKKR
ncbi:MAG: helix-turn-helix transcriptional regulator [Firmicutes bacterium]|nr:helix-turn-helix transcriptional regulator [Bacillota bacterium]